MLKQGVHGTWRRADRDGRIRAPGVLPPFRANTKDEHH
jgi:hypothetical protein